MEMDFVSSLALRDSNMVKSYILSRVGRDINERGVTARRYGFVAARGKTLSASRPVKLLLLPSRTMFFSNVDDEAKRDISLLSVGVDIVGIRKSWFVLRRVYSLRAG